MCSEAEVCGAQADVLAESEGEGVIMALEIGRTVQLTVTSINCISDGERCTRFAHERLRAIRLVLTCLICAVAFVGGLSSASEKATAQTAKSNFKLAYIPCGRVNDQSWSQAGYEGVLAAQKELGVEVAYSESVPPAD